MCLGSFPLTSLHFKLPVFILDFSVIVPTFEENGIFMLGVVFLFSQFSPMGLFSSSPLSKYRVLFLFYVLLRLNA